MADGRITSVNTGRVAPLGPEGQHKSGIDKTPRPGRVAVGPEGLEGDEQGNREVHGGIDKAVYLYAESDYRFWEEALGRPLVPGTFGENLTVSAPDGADLRIGARLRVGSAELAVTGPREPCATLGLRMDDPQFPRVFLREGRTGFYTRLVTPGMVWAGAPVEVDDEGDPRNPTVGEVHGLYASKDRDPGALARMADAPDVPEDWREWARRKA